MKLALYRDAVGPWNPWGFQRNLAGRGALGTGLPGFGAMGRFIGSCTRISDSMAASSCFWYFFSDSKKSGRTGFIPYGLNRPAGSILPYAARLYGATVPRKRVSRASGLVLPVDRVAGPHLALIALLPVPLARYCLPARSSPAGGLGLGYSVGTQPVYCPARSASIERKRWGVPGRRRSKRPGMWRRQQDSHLHLQRFRLTACLADVSMCIGACNSRSVFHIALIEVTAAPLRQIDFRFRIRAGGSGPPALPRSKPKQAAQMSHPFSSATKKG